MTLRTSLLALSVALLIPTASAVPVKFFGQDPTPPDVNNPALTPGGGAVTARADFEANYQTLSVESFEAAADGATSVNLSFAGSTGAITGTITGGEVISGTEANGRFPTAGNKFYKSPGGIDVAFNSPISSFGFYVTDVETVSAVTLTLTPNGSTPGGPNDVVVRYGGVINQGTAGQSPGEQNVLFIGFADTEALYTNINIDFPGQGTDVFGFDELAVGDVDQLLAAKSQVTVGTAQVSADPGWRLLSAPVEGVTPGALALQNLVQGVPAGNGNAQQQYPQATSNFYTSYEGGGRFDYTSASATGTEIEAGRGFWWYWYDVDIDPSNTEEGGGTSESVVLDNFALSVIGTEITTDVVRSFTDNTNNATGSPTNPNPSGPSGETLPADDDFYMIGNPFPDPFSVASISVTGGTLQDCFFAWNPSNAAGQAPTNPDSGFDGPGSYEILFASPASGGPDFAAPWQGLLAEVAETTEGGTVEFTMAVAGTDDTQTPPFYGRQSPETFVHLRLEGTSDSGARVRDEAAYVRLRGDATDTWDRYDGSKPLPPTASYAVIAPMGVRDGEAQPQAVLSLPNEAAVVSVAFLANEAGSHTISWGDLAGVPDGWTATLHDTETGARMTLAPGGSYAFDSPATGWWERFELAFSQAAVAGETAPTDAVVGLVSPNPTAGRAHVTIRLAEAGEVAVALYDALGRQVADARSAALTAGADHAVALPTAGLAPGVYVVRVEGPGLTTSRRLTVLR